MRRQHRPLYTNVALNNFNMILDAFSCVLLLRVRKEDPAQAFIAPWEHHRFEETQPDSQPKLYVMTLIQVLSIAYAAGAI